MNDLKEFWNNHKGEHVITSSYKVERFLAIVSDDTDWYYLTYDGRKFTLHSCVGMLFVLKDKIDQKNYDYFIRLAKLNHLDQDKNILGQNSEIHKKTLTDNLLKEIYIDPDDERSYYFGTNKLITDICWDLN